MLVVAVVSGALLFVFSARPSGDVLSPVAVEQAHVGTSYAFDGVVCLGSEAAGSTVDSVTVEQAAGGTTELVRPDGPVTVGFPVDAGEAEPAEGYEIAAGGQDCTLRVLLTPDELGRVEAGTLRVRLSYGPGGLLWRTVSLRPQVSLDVTETGPDPRASVE